MQAIGSLHAMSSVALNMPSTNAGNQMAPTWKQTVDVMRGPVGCRVGQHQRTYARIPSTEFGVALDDRVVAI